MIRLAGRYGMVVFLDPIETGSWLSVLQSNGLAKAFAYGRYLGKRYAKFPNIVWMSGNDFQDWKNPSSDALVLAVAKGIRSTDHRHIHTVELNYTVSSSLDDAQVATGDRARCRVHVQRHVRRGAQGVQPEARRSRSSWSKPATRTSRTSSPISPGVPQTLRRQEYWTMLSGATGQLYGNHYTWQFLPDWKSHLDTPGTEQIGYLVKLFAGRPWYRLVPDQKHTLLTSGYGTSTSDGNVQSSDYVTAARTPDGKLAMAYLPTVRTVTIDTSKLAAQPGRAVVRPERRYLRPRRPHRAERKHAKLPPARQEQGRGRRLGARADGRFALNPIRDPHDRRGADAAHRPRLLAGRGGGRAVPRVPRAGRRRRRPRLRLDRRGHPPLARRARADARAGGCRAAAGDRALRRADDGGDRCARRARGEASASPAWR